VGEGDNLQALGRPAIHHRERKPMQKKAPRLVRVSRPSIWGFGNHLDRPIDLG